MKVFHVGPETLTRPCAQPPLSLTPTRGTCRVCRRNMLWHYVADPDDATRIIGWRCAGCGRLIKNDEAIGFGQGRSPGGPTLKTPLKP